MEFGLSTGRNHFRSSQQKMRDKALTRRRRPETWRRGRRMWNDIPTRFQPGRWRVSALVLTGVTLLAWACALGASGQERRSRPKLIIVHDNPRQELPETGRESPLPGHHGSGASEPAVALERPLDSSIKPHDRPSGRAPGSEFAWRSKAAFPRIPPLPTVPDFPAVDKPPQPASQQAPRVSDSSSNHTVAKTVTSTVQPVGFFTSDLPEDRTGGRSPLVNQSGGSYPGYYLAAGADVPVWQIVGLSVAISFLLALTLLGFSLLLLTMRQPGAGTPGSVIRFELAQSADGNLLLPFPMTPQMGQLGKQETPLRGPTRVAEFAEDILGAAALGPILGEPREQLEEKQNGPEASILQQIFEDNVALQKKEA